MALAANPACCALNTAHAVCRQCTQTNTSLTLLFLCGSPSPPHTVLQHLHFSAAEGCHCQACDCHEGGLCSRAQHPLCDRQLPHWQGACLLQRCTSAGLPHLVRPREEEGGELHSASEGPIAAYCDLYEGGSLFFRHLIQAPGTRQAPCSVPWDKARFQHTPQASTCRGASKTATGQNGSWVKGLQTCMHKNSLAPGLSTSPSVQ